MSFGALDIGREPEAAAMLGLDASVRSHELPSYFVFADGREIKRVPPRNASKTQAEFVRKMRVDALERALDLPAAAALARSWVKTQPVRNS